MKIESNRWSEFYDSIIQNFSKIKKIKPLSRFRDKGPSIAGRVIRTTLSSIKKPVIEKGNADWLSELPNVIKKYNNTIHKSTEMSPVQASKKAKEKLLFSNLQDRRVKQKAKIELQVLVRLLILEMFLEREIVQAIAMRFIL